MSPRTLDEARAANEAARTKADADPVAMAERLAVLPWLADRLNAWPDPWDEDDPIPPNVEGPDGKARVHPAWRASAATAHLAQVRNADRFDVPNPEGFRQQAARWAVAALADVPETPDSTSGLSLLAAAVERLPVEIEANDRPDPLFPGLMLPRRTWEGRNGKAEALFALQQRSAAARGFLPDLAPGEVDGEAPPARSLPLELWDLAEGGSMRRGRGAPLAARVFVDTVLDVGVDRWGQSSARGVTLPPERFPDFLRRLFPDTWRRWDRRRLPALLEALERVDAARIGYDMIGPDGKPGGAARKVVAVVDKPRTGKRDDWVRFAVHLLPTVKTADAVLLDRPALRRAGTDSAPAWRLVLSLSADWTRPGKTRRPVGRGRHWLQRRGWDAYDRVTDAQLVAMAFPKGGEVLAGVAYRKRLQRARKALDYLAGRGFCEWRRDGKGWRIRPGPKWVGWATT